MVKYNITFVDTNIFEVDIENKKYIINGKQLCKFINANLSWHYNCDTNIYHYYKKNNKDITIIEFLNENYNNSNINITYKNKNIYDIREENCVFKHNKYSEVEADYNIIKYIPGHLSKMGVDAGYMKNPIWFVNNGKENFYLMYCETDGFIKLCDKSLEIIKKFETDNGIKLTFYICANGYAQTTTHIGKLYMHQIILNHYGNGRGTMKTSVDHINRDISDNTFNNLKIATRKEQEKNKIRTGRKRSKMPDGFIEDNFPKYVEYCTEKTQSGVIRDFFRITSKGTPLDKHWCTSKSMKKFTLKEKYNQMIEKYKSVFGDDSLTDVVLL